jgi:hypothetical protein
MSIPPPPLQSFPDESYRSLPEATGSPPGEPLGDWNTSFSGLSFQPFPPEVAKVLMRDLEPGEIEVKPGKLKFSSRLILRVFCAYCDISFWTMSGWNAEECAASYRRPMPGDQY